MGKTIVSHYGIHWDDDGIAYIMQGRGGTTAVGLKQAPPFEVRLPSKKKHCNHQVPLASPMANDLHWDYFLNLCDDELVRSLLPTPKKDGGVYFLEDPTDQYMQQLVCISKLGSPIYNCVVPMWTLTKEAIIEELQQTNILPLIITQAEAKHSTDIQQIAKAAVYLPRKLLISGAKDVVLPPTVKRISTNIGNHDIAELIALPWEGIGANLIRKFMRKEWK